MNRLNGTPVNLAASYFLTALFLFPCAILLADECPNSTKHEDTHFNNQRRTVRVILEKLDAPNRSTPLNDGSGVLVSQYGYILTARHIIEKAIDFERKDGKDVEVQRAGYRIKIRFLMD
jgi:S1-C subfamily serine protease